MSASKKAIIVFAACVLVLVGVAFVLSMRRGTFIAAAQPCYNNLHQLESAKAEWALESGKERDTNAVPTWQDIQPYLKYPLTCPDGGTYTIGRVGEQPKCSLAGQITNGRIHTLPKE